MEIAALASFISLLIAWIVAPNGATPDEITVTQEMEPQPTAA
jgi:hypothetical protein